MIPFILFMLMITNCYADSVLVDQTIHSNGGLVYAGIDGGNNLRKGSQSFTTLGTDSIDAVGIFVEGVDGSPSGSLSVRIETDSSGCPSGTLADPNATAQVIPSVGSSTKVIFPSAWTPVSNTKYHIVIQSVNTQSRNTDWIFYGSQTNIYSGGQACDFVNTHWNSEPYDLYFQVFTGATQTPPPPASGDFIIANKAMTILATGDGNTGSGYPQTGSRYDIWNDYSNFPNTALYVRFLMTGFNNGVPLQDRIESIGGIQNNSDAEGGIRIYGISTGPTGWRQIILTGIPSTSNSMDTGSSSSGLEFQVMKKDLNQQPDNENVLSDNENLMQISNYHSIKLLMKGNGQMLTANGHMTVSGTSTCSRYDQGLCTSF